MTTFDQKKLLYECECTYCKHKWETSDSHGILECPECFDEMVNVIVHDLTTNQNKNEKSNNNPITH